MILESEKARIKIDSAGKIEVEADGDIVISCANADLTCENCAIKASGNIDLGENGKGVMTGGPGGTMPVCFVTGAPTLCSATVKAKP